MKAAVSRRFGLRHSQFIAAADDDRRGGFIIDCRRVDVPQLFPVIIYGERGRVLAHRFPVYGDRDIFP